MTLNNIAEEFNQCNKCGLCMARCPVCKELLLEKYSQGARSSWPGSMAREYWI